MNPFRYQRPVSPQDVIDREPEVRAIVEAAASGGLVRLDAPRRFGKTSVIGKAFAEAQRDDTVTVLVDLYGVLSLREVAERIELAYRRLRGPVDRRVRDLLSSYELSFNVGVARGTLRAASAEESDSRRLLELLDLPQRIAERGVRRVLVAFDEFQDVLRIERLDALMRSRIQHHDEFAGYVFAGSSPRMMGELFGRQERPFWGQAQRVQLGRLGAEDVAAHVSDRFAESGRDAGTALRLLLGVADGHPQRAMLLAHELWERTPRRGAADESTWAAALRAVEESLAEGFEAQWRAAEANEQRVLRAIAAYGISPHSVQARRQVGLKPGSAGRALAKLQGEAVIERRGDDGWALVDPLFALWIRAGAAPLPAADGG
jgi:uncharacterized protein